MELTDQRQQWQAQRQMFHLSKAVRIINVYYNRLFLNNFKSHVFMALLRPQSKPVQNDWPYKALLLKKNKTEEEELEIEFISMCAEKIQAVFKGYLTRKRHLKAIARLRQFSKGMVALVKGWKVRQIFKCHGVSQRTKIITAKQKELDKEKKGDLSTPYAIRKLQYLQMTLNQDKSHFVDNFYGLYISGAWVFEPKDLTKQRLATFNKKHNDVRPIKGGNYTQQAVVQESSIAHEVPPKKKRVREMRDRREREVPKPEVPQQSVQSEENEFGKINENYSRVSTAFPGQDRPIQAKGSYSMPGDESIMEAQALAERPVVSNEDNEEPVSKKDEIKKIEKKKHEKRQKYDPRKAIQEEKQRKKEQAQRQKEMMAEAPSLKPQPSSQSDVEAPPRKNPQKTRQKIKAEKEQSNRSTVNISKPVKGKVESKIDCWSNRKTVLPKKNQQRQIRLINPQQVDQELINFEKLIRKIDEKKKLKERSQFSEERLKELRQIEKHKEELQQTRPRKDSFGTGFELASRKQQKIEQIRAQERPRQAEEKQHRSVEQLQDAYNAQYLKRLKGLTPKLGLMQAAREQQLHGRIPVLSEWQIDRLMVHCSISQYQYSTVAHQMALQLREFARS